MTLKMKRICSILMVVMLVASLAAGCSKKTENATDTAVTPTGEASSDDGKGEATPTEAETLEPYEVVWYQMGNGMTADNQKVLDAVNEKLKDINTTLKLVYFSWGEYTDKINMIINSGEKFDLCFTSGGEYIKNAAKGAFLDITDTFETNMPKFSKVLQKGFVEGAKINGHLYGLPTNKEMFGHYGFDVDKGIAEKAGIDLDSIKTLADMDKALRTVKEKVPDVTPLFVRTGNELNVGQWDSIGGSDGSPGVVMLNDPGLKVINEMESPEKMALWKQMHTWYEDGLINDNPATVQDDTIWTSGKAFARPGQLGVTPDYPGPANNVIHRITMGEKYTSTSTVLGAMIAFSSTSPDPERAMMFYDRFATDSELYNLITYGIEGEHYVITDKTTTPWTEGYPEGIDDSNVGYKSSGSWALGGDWFMTYLSPTDPKNRNELVEEGNKAAVLSPALGFTFDATNVTSEIAACANVYAEYKDGLNTGMLDPEKYAPDFIQKLKDNGVDKIIEEKQKQIDAWKATNAK